MAEDPRALLERLIRERGEDYAGLSRLIGRNPAYVQQYIKRGTPRRLAEEDRRALARYFRIDEGLLGAPDREPRGGGHGLVAVPRLDVGASAGSGAEAREERAIGQIAFDEAWLRRMRIGGGAGQLSMIRVEGDSMVPTLSDGDEIMVDRGDSAERLRDGIYVLRIDDALVVKRVARNPAKRSISVRSDNEAYPSWPDCDPAAVDVVGRVVWVGRRLL
jgi:phage repressor protein C with HTH and peptisase S24 domain